MYPHGRGFQTGWVLFLLWIFVQNIFAAFAAKYTELPVEWVIGLKDAVLILGGGVSVAAFFLGERRDTSFLFFSVYCGVILVYLGIGWTQNIASLRQLLIIPLFFFFGTVVSVRRISFKEESAIVKLFAILCIVSLVERYFLFTPDEFFLRSVGVPELMGAKGFGAWAYGPFELPGNFYSFDGIAFGHDLPIRRLVGVLLEPTLIGQWAVFPLVLGILSRKPWLTIAAGAIIVSAISKGGFLAAGVALLCVTFVQTPKLGGILASVVALLSALLMPYVVEIGSVQNHMAGLITSLEGLVAHPFGLGIGAAGNFASLSGTALTEPGFVARESYLAALIGQLGMVGVVYFSLVVVLAIKGLIVYRRETFALAVFSSIVGTMAAALFSESAISFVGTGFLFMLWPMVAKRARNKNMEGSAFYE